MTAATYQRTAKSLLPVADYERVSKDKGKDQGKGSGLAVDRQRTANRAYAEGQERLAGQELVSYTDNDTSGWDPAVTRPGFDSLLADIRAGKLAAVVAWHVDRISRQPAQIEALWAACKDSGTELHTVLGGHITSGLMLRVMSALAAEESDVKSERQLLKHAQLAKDGHFHGGKRRFGYELDMSIRDDEATTVRTLAAKLLNGESLASCARWLDAEGIAAPLGGKWTGSNIGVMIQRPHLAGLRVHHGDAVTDASWQPILSRADHDALTTKLGAKDRRTSFTNARVYLLAGLALCGNCGAKVRGRSGGRRASVRVSYVCADCGGIHRNADDVDSRVTAAIVARLARVDVRGLLAEADGAGAELDRLTSDWSALTGRKKRLAARHALGEISDDAYDYGFAAIETEETRLDEAIRVARDAVSSPVRALDGLTGPNPRERFAGLPLARQRAVIDLLAVVTIDKAARKGAPFDPELIRVVPR